MENAKVTIKDIAEMAGVSKSTVSRYMNHGYISEEKAAKIAAAIEKTGFESNFFAKRMKAKQSKLIGLVLPRMDSVSAGRLFSGVLRILEPAGYQLMIQVSQLDSKKELAAISSLKQQGVDGILMDSVEITREHIALQKEVGIPIVYTGQRRKGVDCLKFDDYEAGRMMGAFLKGMGHKRAVFAGVAEKDKAVGVERKQGFFDAFLEDNPKAEAFFIKTGFNFQDAYRKASEIYQKQPSVIVGATDNISLGILRYLHEHGIGIPDEISVTGFGGYDVGAVVYPALTSVFFDFELVGMHAAQRLLDRIEGNEVREDVHLPLFFVERESVKRLADEG